jgi:hypothetical protein
VEDRLNPVYKFPPHLYKFKLNIIVLSTPGYSEWSPLDKRSRSSSVTIVPGYGLDDRAIEVRSPAGAKDISSSLCVQTGSEVHPASCPVGTGGSFPWRQSAAGA